jgi:hypothetical protein
VPVRVGAVDLVELRQEGRTYRWETLHSIPLGTVDTAG